MTTPALGPRRATVCDTVAAADAEHGAKAVDGDAAKARPSSNTGKDCVMNASNGGRADSWGARRRPLAAPSSP